MGEQLDIFNTDGTLKRTKEGRRGLSPTRQMRAQEKRARKAADKPSIDQRFAEFHAANPHVLTEMLRLARQRIELGERRIGVKALWEELRSWLKVTGQGDYKLNNDFTALYARKLVELEKQLDGVIEMRRRKGT